MPLMFWSVLKSVCGTNARWSNFDTKLTNRIDLYAVKPSAKLTRQFYGDYCVCIEGCKAK